MAKPNPELTSSLGFFPILDAEGKKTGIDGSVNVAPHPNFPEVQLMRVQVRWGMFFFRKILTLETLTNKSNL